MDSHLHVHVDSGLSYIWTGENYLSEYIERLVVGDIQLCGVTGCQVGIHMLIVSMCRRLKMCKQDSLTPCLFL